MESNENINADYCIEIDFDKQSENPSRVFKAMTEFIESFQKIDKILVESIDNKIEPVIILEDIESGSLKTWLVNKLKNVDDDVLKSGDYKKLIGHYLVKGKYFLINFLEKKTSITDRLDVVELQTNILKLAEETDVKKFPEYTPITPQKIIESIGYINKASSYLDKNKDKVKYITSENETGFNLEFNYSVEDIEEILTKEKLESIQQAILKVKKPDYLGSSKWDFKYENKVIQVKILDDEWLNKFQNREIDVRPGDSLRVSLKIIHKYGYDYNIVGIQYDIVKIIEVIKKESDTQLKFRE